MILTRIHTYFNIMELLLMFKVWSTHQSYSYLTTRLMWFCWFRLSRTQHIHAEQNKYKSCVNTKILTNWLCVFSACCSICFAYVDFLTFLLVYHSTNHWDHLWVHIILNAINLMLTLQCTLIATCTYKSTL